MHLFWNGVQLIKNEKFSQKTFTIFVGFKDLVCLKKPPLMIILFLEIVTVVHKYLETVAQRTILPVIHSWFTFARPDTKFQSEVNRERNDEPNFLGVAERNASP